MHKSRLARWVGLVTILFLGAASLSASELETRVRGELAVYYSRPFRVVEKMPGEIVIEGKVQSCWDRRNVFVIASRVQGVMMIEDKVIVETGVVPPEMIKANVENGLVQNTAIVEPEKIKVDVDGNLVFLTGTVSFARESHLAEDIASWQPGVINVVNEIKVLPATKAQSDENLTAFIKDLIHRDFLLEEKNIKASCVNGKVTLTGTVGTLWARNALPKEVSKIHGVTAVENHLKVGSPVSVDKT